MIEQYVEQVKLLVNVLPYVAKEDCFALKGGTAINLFIRDLPRLSVDIDLDFTVNVSREELPEIKEKFKKRLTDYMWQEGYSLADSRDHFA